MKVRRGDDSSNAGYQSNIACQSSWILSILFLGCTSTEYYGCWAFSHSTVSSKRAALIIQRRQELKPLLLLSSPPIQTVGIVGEKNAQINRRLGLVPLSLAKSSSSGNQEESEEDRKGRMEAKEFWNQQKALMQEMTTKAERSIKQEQLEKFAARRAALIDDTAMFIALIFCALWSFFENPFVAFSYTFGSLMGLAYAYGLGKYVESIGGSADDTDSVQGAGLGQARFAFLILLFVIVGRFRSDGLLEIPAILGFFTYQLASLSQGLREIND